MKKTGLVMIAVLTAVAVVTGCGGAAVSSSPEKNKGPAPSYDEVLNVVQVTPEKFLDSGAADPEAQTAAVGANDFAFRLSAALIKDINNNNFVCSPYSVWMPLAALLNATNAENKEALLAALGASGITEADMNRAASRMLYDLTNEWRKENKVGLYREYYNPLKIVNAIFVSNQVTLRTDFAQTFMDYYRGSSINVDFFSSEAVDAVNQWASDNTEGLIHNVVSGFDPYTVAAIANAIYFSDRWSSEFDPEQTKEDVFHLPGGGEKTAFYMLKEGEGHRYYDDDKVQAVRLGFKNSGYNMYIILPRDGDAAALLASMTTSYFNEIESETVRAAGKLLLPRFSVENEIKGLKEALIALGVPLFNKESLPITMLIEEKDPLYLSGAIQKALIKVDEKGTTAAAVTIMSAVSGSYQPQPPPKPFEMICDKPFVFILYDYTQDGGSQILFTGVVNRP